MNVAYELRCPKCRGFVSGCETDPGVRMKGYCRACPLRFEANLEPTRGQRVDIVKIRVRTFA